MADPVMVIGGGAAGLMAALHAARTGAVVQLLEASRQCGLKILVSGGGRCNVLPSQFDAADFFTQGSRRVLERLFRTWPLAEVTEFFESDLGVRLTTERETGKVFPASQSARDVRDALLAAVGRAGGRVRTGARVAGIERVDGGYRVTLDSGERLGASRLIMATGGKSLPRTGSDGSGYEFVRSLGHSILDTYPALVPLTTDDAAYTELSGIALPVRWTAMVGGKRVEERERELLFTHRGFSGPAILDASHWFVRDRGRLEIAWGAMGEDEWRKELVATPRRPCLSTLASRLPRRLAEVIAREAGLDPETTPSNLSREVRERLIERLVRNPIPVTGSVGYRVAEVTGGGVPLAEVNPSTLESRESSGLYLCGEILDVIGRIGGFNFLWAWVTGRLAGESATRP